MYLPLTGFDEKKKTGEKMSINSIGSSLTTYAVQQPERAVAPQQESQQIAATDGNKLGQGSGQTVADAEQKSSPPVNPLDTMNTKDFLVLRTQAQDSPYEVLDEVIAKMKDNIKELGDAIEAMARMTKETSKEQLALQLLEATFEAIDEMRGE